MAASSFWQLGFRKGTYTPNSDQGTCIQKHNLHTSLFSLGETHYMLDLIVCLFSYIGWLFVAGDTQIGCSDVAITFFSLSLILGSSDSLNPQIKLLIILYPCPNTRGWTKSQQCWFILPLSTNWLVSHPASGSNPSGLSKY